MEARALVGEARALYFPTVILRPVLQPFAILGQSQCDQFQRQHREEHRRSTPCRWTFPGRRICLAESATKSMRRNITPRSARRIWRTNGSSSRRTWPNFYFEIRGQDALIQLFTQTVAAISEVAGSDPGTIRHRRRRSDSPSWRRGPPCSRPRRRLTNLGILRAQYEHAIAVLLGKPASGFLSARRVPSPRRRRRFPSACRLSCCSAGRTWPRPNEPWLRPMRNWVWPTAPSTLP